MTNHQTVIALYCAALESRHPIAVWRAPGASAVHAVVDLSGQAEPVHIDFRADEPGFVLAPFCDEDGRPALRIRADVHLADGRLHPGGAARNGGAGRYERFLHAMETCQIPAAGWYASARVAADRISTRQQYGDLVRAAIGFIEANDIKKVVVSRRIEVPLPEDFSALGMFFRLCGHYPAAFVSLVALPGVGTWLGASPELLLSVDATRISTVALAGTRPMPANRDLSAVQWSAKEIEEQSLVSDYIRAFFTGAGYAGVDEQGPQTVAAGNVAHLLTRFQANLAGAARLDLANRVLHELHPTSAVCGMPKDKALAFILEHEGYDRSFYSGYLGPVYIAGKSELYVNLRCMQLESATASLYVGGGVTRDSDPDAEWVETELKAGTLLAALDAPGSPSLAAQPPVSSVPAPQ